MEEGMQNITRGARWAVFGLAVLLLVNLVTGMVFAMRQEGSGWGECHHWAGSIMVIGSGLAFAVSFVAFLTRAIVLRQWRRGLLGSTVGFFAFLLTLNTSFTGYLGPSHLPDIHQETLLRFQAIHMVFEPALLAVVLVAWWLLL